MTFRITQKKTSSVTQTVKVNIIILCVRVAFHNLFYFHSVHITLYSQPRRDGSLGGTFIKGMLPGERQFGKIYILLANLR